MNDILDKNEINTSIKIKKFAFLTFVLVLSLFLVKFSLFYNTYLQINSPFIPEYTLSFALQDSFLSGIIMSIGSIISFMSFNYKQYKVSLIINVVLIISHFTFPYFYYLIVSNTL